MRTLLLCALLLCACDAASTAVVDNAFTGTFTVWRAWWQTTYFPAPVAPASSSDALRTVPGTDTAWVVLVRDWDGGTPDTFIAARSSDKLTLQDRGDALHIPVSAPALVGLCGIDGPLSNQEAATAELIFPDELSGTYDQTTCTYLPPP
jgi:hypothetical protein